jgi:PAS domain S-box-containing protein
VTPTTPAPTSRQGLLAARRWRLHGALALLGLLAAALTAWFVVQDRHDTEREALAAATLYARVLEDQVTRSLTAVATTVRSLSAHGTLRRSPEATQPARQLLEQQLVGQPLLRSLAVLDSDGRVVVSTVDGEAGLRVDLAVLGAPATPAARETIGALLPIRDLGDLARGGVRDATALPMLRPVPMDDGAPPMWLVAVLNPDHFATQHAVITADSTVRATVADLHGRVIASSAADVAGTPDLSALEPFRRFLPQRESGSYIGAGSDGTEVVAAFRLSRRWPLVVLAEQPLADVLAASQERVRSALGVCAAFVAMLAVLGWVADRGLRREQQALEREARFQRELAEAEERWKLALEGAGHGVWDVDLATGRASLSPRLLDLTGPPPHGAAWTQDQLRDAVHPDDREPVALALARHLRGESPQFSHELRLRGADGRWHWLLASATRLDSAAGRRLIGTTTDVGERRAIELALRDSEARFRSAFEQAAVGMLEQDRTGRVLRANPALCRMLGLSADEIAQRTVRELVHPEDFAAATQDIEGLFAGRLERLVAERRYRHRDGNYVWGRYTASVLRRTDGRDEHLLAIVEDVSARRAAEDALAEARQRELSVGARIQQALLAPSPSAALHRVWLGTLNQASQGIDGDFVDVIALGDDTLDLVVGDVMGKGVAAALLGAATKMQFSRSRAELLARSVGGARLPSPVEIVGAVHARMTLDLQALEAFVTLCYVRLDVRTGTVAWVGCGHEEPLLLRPGEAALPLGNQHPPLGVLDRVDYEQTERPLRPGDALFLASDGAVDALMPDGSRLGRERLAATLRRLVAEVPTPAAVLHVLRHEIVAAGATITDDLTMALAFVAGPHDRGGLLELHGGLADVGRVRALVEPRALAAGLDEVDASLFTVACVEAYTNAVRHTRDALDGAPVEVAVRALDDRIVVEIVRPGAPYEVPSLPPDTDFAAFPEGGFGLRIMRDGTDAVEHVHAAGVNTVRLTRWTARR